MTIHLLTMVVIILRIHTNSQQCTHISKETIFDHFPASEIFSIKFRLNHFYTFDHFSTAIFDQIPILVFDQNLLSRMNVEIIYNPEENTKRECNMNV